MSELGWPAAASGLQMGAKTQDEVVLLECADTAFLEGRPSRARLQPLVDLAYLRPGELLHLHDAVFLNHSGLEWFRREFSQAALKAGLGKLNLVPHSLRRAGPSWGALVQRTHQREI